MLSENFRLKVRKVMGALCVSAGVLAIANIETIWQEYHHDQYQEAQQFPTAQKDRKLVVSPPEVAKLPNFKPLQSELSRSLEQDELGDESPFAHLSTLDPLQHVMRKGVEKFRRDTFRSSGYKQETGYDVVSYEVHHTDGSKSTILAYLESPQAAENRVPFVIFMVSNGQVASYSFFRSGNLIEQSDLTPTEASTLVSNRLSSAVPFLSVSR